MASISIEEANAIIEDIMLDNGGIDEEERREARPRFLRAFNSMRKKLAATTST